MLAQGPEERKILYTELLIDKEFGHILPCFTGLMRISLIGEGGVLVCHLPPEL